MRTLMRQTALELKLIARMRWPLLLPPAAGAYIWLQLLNLSPTGSQDLYLHMLTALGRLHTFAIGLPVLLGILLVRRDILHHAYEWLRAASISNHTFLLSKVAAGILYLSLIPLFIDLVYLLECWKQGLSLPYSLSQISLVTIHMLVAYAISLVLGITLGVLLPSRFALPVGFCAWVFGSVFIQLFIVSSYSLYPLKAFYLNHLLDNPLILNEGWLGALAGRELARLLPFVLLFGVFLLALSWAVLGHERPERSRRTGWMICLLALMIAAAGYIPYAQMWMERYTDRQLLMEISPQQHLARANEVFAFEVSRVKLDVRLQQDESLAVEARIDFPVRDGRPVSVLDAARPPEYREPGRITFLLHPGMRIKQAFINGKPADYIRTGDRFSIDETLLDSNQEIQSVSVAYEGRITDWGYYGTREFMYAFASRDAVMLPGGMGWYPLPGGDSLFYKSGEHLFERLDTARYFNADFDVTVSGFGSLPLYATLETAPAASDGSQHYTGSDTAAFTLYGGRFEEVRIQGEPITIITTRANRRESERFLEELYERRLYYEEWLGTSLDRIRYIAYFPMDAIDSRYQQWTNERTGNTIFLSEMLHNNLDAYRLHTMLRYMLFGDRSEVSFADKNDSTQSIVYEIRETILDIYNVEHPGKSRFWHRQGMTFTPLSGPGSNRGVSAGEYLSHFLSAAAAEGQIDRLKDTLKHFYEGGLHIKLNEYGGSYIEEEYNGRQYMKITLEDWHRVWDSYKR
ncbi:hypothetical protein DNH61_16105 [Paenibacillus sambharensis]|uniref:Uncharacterized protein n=1 Tax=Paenibacillus sambharensis TaxID=1803190 RepID=A0A2W1LTN4_9BACL|nr:hypothetical protein [Paenibacillus sambharensis]PZD94817.1 hypothetical protein DNH61_16105 [Paenibacillus sambharensis]